MDNTTVKPADEGYSIDLLQLVKALWKRAWLIVLAAILAGGIGFSVASFLIAPTYSSSILVYVNNGKAAETPNYSISSADINAAKSLVSTYGEILKNRTTLERVINRIGLDYTVGELSGMITASPANNTEIMRVTVVSEDPYEAAEIANTIAQVLPVRISEIIDGASMEVVDLAIPNTNKIAPSVTKFTAIGMLLGIVLAAAIVVIQFLLDDTIHDEEYITRNYECPILAKIPDLSSSSGKHYGGYYQQSTPAEKK